MRAHGLNALLFMLGSCACVVGGAWLWLSGALLAVQVASVNRWREEGKLLLSVALLGCAVESFTLQIGLLNYPHTPALVPLPHALFWLLLACTLNHSLAWSKTPWWRASVLGAALAVLYYSAVSYLQPLTFALGTLQGVALMALIWAVLLPVFQGFARLYAEQTVRSR